MLGRRIFWRLLFSIFLVIGLAALDHALRPWKPNWLNFSIDKDAQREFLTTLGGVSAALLALYFTAISVVVSTAYSKTPGNIRSLIIKEDVGSVYFSTLALFAGVATVLLAALAFGYHVGAVNTALAMVMCLFSIFGFVVLGVRAFEYFDPTVLVDLLNRDILEEIQSVTPTGHQWLDQSFQAHHQRKAEELLKGYADLATVASQKENLHGKGLIELGRGLLLILNVYAKQKTRIPSSSFWYRRTFRHKNWLLTSYSEVEIALITGTVVQPDTVPDLMWFETDVIRIIEDIFQKLGERRDLAGIAALASSLHNHMGGMGQCLAISEGVQVLKAILPKIRTIYIGQVQTVSDSTSTTDGLAISELFGCAFINLSLGIFNELEQVSQDSLKKLNKTIDWRKPESLYQERILPREVIREMEFVQQRFDFEFRLEGKIITPEWLRVEMLAYGYVEFFDEMTKLLLTGIEDIFGKETEARLEAKDYVLVAQLVQRGLEACEKLSSHFGKYKARYDEFVTLNRSKEYTWPVVDWDTLQTKIANLREKLIIALANSSTELVKLPEQPSWPDFFGHAYSVLAEECFKAMDAGNENLFKVVFPAFFQLALQAGEKLRVRFLGDIRNILVSGDPLADLMAISGYAALFSELDAKNFWQLTELCWNNYFSLYSENGKLQQFIKFLCLIVEPTSQTTLSPRSVLRTRWQQMFGRVLRARGVLPKTSAWYGGRIAGRHSSLLIRVFSRSEYLMTQAYDVFLTLYIFKRPESADVEKPSNVEYLQQSLERGTEDENDE